MQLTFRWLKWLCLGLAVMGIIIPGIIGWLTGTFSLQIVADWFQQRLVSLAALHETNPYAFQFRTALVIGLPALVFFGAVGGLAHLAEKISSAPKRTYGIHFELGIYHSCKGGAEMKRKTSWQEFSIEVQPGSSAVTNVVKRESVSRDVKHSTVGKKLLKQVLKNASGDYPQRER